MNSQSLGGNTTYILKACLKLSKRRKTFQRTCVLMVLQIGLNLKMVESFLAQRDLTLIQRVYPVMTLSQQHSSFLE